MKMYELKCDVDEYLGCYLKNGSLSEEQKYEFSRAKKLSFVPDFSIEYDTESKIPIGDYIRCWSNGAIHIISEKAQSVFESKLDSEYEMFPIQDEYGNTVYVFNMLTCIDALNPEKTQYKYFKNLKARVEKYSFKEDIEYPMVFQIFLTKDFAPLSHFVTEAFVRLVEEAGLKGFKFNEVWDSEKE